VIVGDPGFGREGSGEGLADGTDVGKALGAGVAGVRVEGAGTTVVCLGAAGVGRVAGWAPDGGALPPQAARPAMAATATAAGAIVASLMT
jgi:hypothetical protein